MQSKYIKAFSVNAVILTIMYLGFAKSIEGFENIALVLLWVIIFFKSIHIGDYFVENLSKNLDKISSSGLQRSLFSLFYTAILLFFDFTLTASAYFLSYLIFDAAIRKAKERDFHNVRLTENVK